MIAILKRDLLLAFRAGGSFGLPLAFFLILTLFVPFGIGSDADLLARVAPGILWIGALLACLLSLDRIFLTDFEDGTLDMLATAPIPLEGIAATKALAHWITTGLPLCLAAAPLAYMLNLPSTAYGALIGGLLIGTPALSFIGAFGAALVVGLRKGNLLLSLLILPFYIPTLIFGAELATRAITGKEITTPLAMLAGLTAFSLVIMPIMAALALRANLR